MPEGPFPHGWIDKQVGVETAGGGAFVGRVVDSNAGGCIIVREVVEGDNPESVVRHYFYPWASIRSIKLLDEPEEEGGGFMFGRA